jgi:hypothetical protein
MPLRRLAFFASSGCAVCALALVATPLSACGDDAEERWVRAVDAAVDHVPAKPTVPEASTPPRLVADAACGALTQTHPIAGVNHVPEDTVLSFATNPPSSGDHYPRWANFQEFPNPVPDGYLVHSMEHGAVVLFYKCEGTACDPIVSALRAVRDSIESDPLCSPSIRLRVILAPRPASDAPVSAAAWGATYKSECVDPPSISQFVRDHYARGPENFCAQGTFL